MSEHPEVENFARALSAEYGGKIIRVARLHQPDLRSTIKDIL
jgi:formamidopyrimidine-DNA glycosylase